jgi:ubiquinone/menaquinone biosynthesis C-methylase UbiE
VTSDRVSETNQAVQAVFGQRAAFYRTSSAHTDPRVLARLVELADPQPQWIALDLATGAGHTALALAPHVRRVTAFDLTRAMLAEAASLGAATRLDFDLCRGDVHRLPFLTGAFDLVTCRRAAHHFADLSSSLAEMRRVLRPRGRLVIDDRSVPDVPEADALMNRLDLLHDPSHVREYSPDAWATMLANEGFTLEKVQPYARLRPARDLSDGAGPHAAAEVDRLISEMSPETARLFGRVRQDGAWHIRHWYVMVSARVAS